VVTRVGGNPDLIADGERGLVVPPYAPELLAGAVERLLALPTQARRMGWEGRAFVERELTFQQLCDRHDALYRAILDAPGLFERPGTDQTELI
jgi:glycosyltransferase involved in cell wall biosynthesis